MECNYRWIGGNTITRAESSGEAIDSLKKMKNGMVEGWTPNTGWMVLARHDGKKIVWDHKAIERHIEEKYR